MFLSFNVMCILMLQNSTMNLKTGCKPDYFPKNIYDKKILINIQLELYCSLCIEKSNFILSRLVKFCNSKYWFRSRTNPRKKFDRTLISTNLFAMLCRLHLGPPIHLLLACTSTNQDSTMHTDPK